MKALALVGYKVAADAAGKAVMFAITVVAAHRLPAEAFAVFALASTLGWILAVLSDCGVQLHVAREIARRPTDAAGIVRRWFRVRSTLAAASAVVIFAAAVLGYFPGQTLAWVVIVVAYLLSGLVEFFHYVYRGLARTDLESSLVLTQRLLMLGAAIAVLMMMPRLDLLAFALLLPAMVTLGLSLGISKHLFRDRRSRESRNPTGRSGSDEMPLRVEFSRDVLPIGAGIVLSAVYFRLDVFLIEWWSGATSVALYAAVFRLVEALRMFPAAVLAVSLPALCRARDCHPLLRISGAVTAFGILLCAPLAMAAPAIVTLIYGASFAAAGPALRVLLLSFPLLSLNYALTHQLIAWNAHRAYAAICAAAVVVNVLLNAVLIPADGIVGAAWATLATEAFLTGGCAIALSRVRAASRFTIAAVQTAPVFGGD